MSSKDKILNAIKGVDIKRVEAPLIPDFEFDEDLVVAFKRAMEINHASVVDVNGEKGTLDLLKKMSADFKNVCAAFPIANIACTYAYEVRDPLELSGTELGIIKGAFGVAETGAIWMPEENYHHRVLPFISEHLVIVLDRNTLVSNMHKAYQSINLRETGYGAFISGPSKTGDIEQTLVIGAHGPRSLTVILQS